MTINKAVTHKRINKIIRQKMFSSTGYIKSETGTLIIEKTQFKDETNAS